jgi:hypothetical protein
MPIFKAEPGRVSVVPNSFHSLPCSLSLSRLSPGRPRSARLRARPAAGRAKDLLPRAARGGRCAAARLAFKTADELTNTRMRPAPAGGRGGGERRDALTCVCPSAGIQVALVTTSTLAPELAPALEPCDRLVCLDAEAHRIAQMCDQVIPGRSVRALLPTTSRHVVLLTATAAVLSRHQSSAVGARCCRLSACHSYRARRQGCVPPPPHMQGLRGGGAVRGGPVLRHLHVGVNRSTKGRAHPPPVARQSAGVVRRQSTRGYPSARPR